MPEKIRTANEWLRSRPWRRGFLATFATVNLSLVLGTSVQAEVRFGTTAIDAVRRSVSALRAQEITVLTLILALLGFAMFATVLLFRGRRAADRFEF